jgi:hypothetical protein
MKIDTIFQNYLTKKEFVPKMAYISRIMEISLPKKQSAFLWGPRKTGKTTYLNEKFENNHFIDLLHTDDAIEFSKRPALLREQILALAPEKKQHPIIIDEVQKVPAILDEIHWLIENKGMQSRAGLNLFITNSADSIIKLENAWKIYKLRWQIELIFKIWKSICNIDKIKKVKEELLECYMFSKLMMIVSGWKVVWQIADWLYKKEHKALSFFKAFKTLVREKMDD